MKFLRCLDADGTVRFAECHSDGVLTRLEGSPFTGFTSTSIPVTASKLLAPILPTTIFCIGLNYHRHAEETGARVPDYPVVFMKGPNTVQHPGEPIQLPTALRSDAVDYECELAVIIGKTGKNIPREQAAEFVLGYTCANDVSARDWQKAKGGTQWCRGKTFDTFCPLGPLVATPESLPNPNALAISTTLNNEIVQDANTSDMIFDVPALIAFLSGSTTLLAGTLLLTGTPHGVGMARQPPLWLKHGDSVTVTIEGIGSLTNPVENEGP